MSKKVKSNQNESLIFYMHDLVANLRHENAKYREPSRVYGQKLSDSEEINSKIIKASLSIFESVSQILSDSQRQQVEMLISELENELERLMGV